MAHHGPIQNLRPPLIEPRLAYAPLGEYGTPTEISLLTGIPRRTLHRWLVTDIPESQADRVAVKLGLHPCELWPEWWDER